MKAYADNNWKQYYKSYNKILTKAINEAKHSVIMKKITNSNNTIKTTCNIIKTELGKKKHSK
jgi:hypothetical protein